MKSMVLWAAVTSGLMVLAGCSGQTIVIPPPSTGSEPGDPCVCTGVFLSDYGSCHCINGLICDSDRCAAPSSLPLGARCYTGDVCASGICSPTPATEPHTVRATVCCAKACGGIGPCGSRGCTTDGTACVFEAKGTPCPPSTVGPRTCLDGYTSAVAACDGAGVCVVDPEPVACAPGYRCMEDIGCATRCGRDYDCDVPAYRCDITTSTCVANRDGGVD